ncbi:MAG: type II toxin-antitoxin system VapC family toxin [Terracidiphilus sp.]|jgi:PIN domain nuclease of toxin-antitoxin system
MVGPVLLDTCAAIWLMSGEPLSAPSRTAIRSARAENLGVYLSPFSAWEIGTLVAKGRLSLSLSPESWFDTLLAMPGVRLATLTPRLLISSTALPGTPLKDPADRIIAATARLYGYRLITRDGKLLDYAREGHILATKC